MFGEITIAQILLSAFSGIGVFIIGKKIINRYKSRDKKTEIKQRNNIVKGDMSAGDILKTNNAHSIDTKRNSSKVNQSDNIVGGDMAGGNILKKD